MSETHELRLKIDAAPAEAGARRFTAAVDAVKRAVRDLDKDTAGAFTKLKSIRPEVDVTPLTRATTTTDKLGNSADRVASSTTRAADNIRKLAIQSANSLRVSTDQASRLRDRLLSIGDTAGLAKLEAGLARKGGRRISDQLLSCSS